MSIVSPCRAMIAVSFAGLPVDLENVVGDRALERLNTLGEVRLRKAELARLIGKGRGPIKYSEHFEDDGAAVLRHACDLSLEGIVSKHRERPYRVGRCDHWHKVKNRKHPAFSRVASFDSFND